ncbi:unnamed protein product [Microthlaspi erraticum]|uniref:4'-phosphopantetheinyl transferase domain-containing protein n=1 Tax=Microthlaspi erraticum TaxID=1685480 RepID=A0A6D2HQR3_9BRAS|nr:unnamed protein product [Microthlaspi erraticum]CAA7027271.1 unnamed protein product [Microthlaspi erraticum]CAA7049605.1 unnamed protein product [Microthlaspi erraticum]CAA7062129.1 unnamed protein product [Microthlaspi erraticum]
MDEIAKARKSGHKVIGESVVYGLILDDHWFWDPDRFWSTITDIEAQRKRLIKLWTLKEAYVKASGKDFSASPFNTFSIIQTEESYNLLQAEKGSLSFWNWLLLLIMLQSARVGEWKSQ